MITVVCLSPSLDQTIALPSLIIGGTNRCQEKKTVPGGKGVNVALALRAMGEAVTLALFKHAQDAQPLMEAVENAGVVCKTVDVSGRLRTNLKILDQSAGVITEINAQSEPVPEAAIQEMEDVIVLAAQESEWLVLTGSMPKAYPADAYARIIRRVRRTAPACRIALDAEGEALALGVAEQPDLIKPNRHELEGIAGRALGEDAALVAAAKEITEKGVGTVLVSMDREGSLLVAQDCILRAGAVNVPVVTTVGAGDAMLSGFLHAYKQGMENALLCGVAAASARVAGNDGAYRDYLANVQIQ